MSTLPTLANSFRLKTWRGGLDSGKPKLSPHRQGSFGPWAPAGAVFTEVDIAALHAVLQMSDRRLADPKKFAHVRQELGIEPVPATDAPKG